MTTAIATPLPATRAEWLAQRRTGIGGSDVASILGLSPGARPIKSGKTRLAEEKIKTIPPHSTGDVCLKIRSARPTPTAPD